MKMKAYASFDDYLADQGPKNQTILRALRKFVKRVAPSLTESVKWGNGCWLGQKGPVAYVYSDPGFVQFGFFRGATLDDPLGLLEGKGAYVRHIKVRSPSDIDEKAFATLLRQAAAWKTAPKAKSKPRSSTNGEAPKPRARRVSRTARATSAPRTAKTARR